jgi:hypothetical protein
MGDPDDVWSHLAGEECCYLTTVGRRTGKEHTIEIWFAIRGPTVYMLAGDGQRSDWVRNLARTPEVSLRIGGGHRGRSLYEKGAGGQSDCRED